MKTKLMLLGLCALLTTAAIAQTDRPVYNTQNNTFIKPTPAELRSANAFQQQGAILDALRANSGVVDISGISLKVNWTTDFFKASNGHTFVPLIFDTAGATQTRSPGGGTLNFSDSIATPNITLTGALTGRKATLSTPLDETGLSITATDIDFVRTTPLLSLKWGVEEMSGSQIIVIKDFEDSTQFSVDTLGNIVGHGAGITNLNTANISTGILGSVHGGTGNGFTKFTGPASSERTFTLPNANATIARTDAAQTFTGTQTFGAVLGSNFNKITLTAPATGSTITIADGKTFSVNNTITLAGTDSTTITFQGTDTYVGRATTDTLTNKTLTAPIFANSGYIQDSGAGKFLSFTTVSTPTTNVNIKQGSASVDAKISIESSLSNASLVLAAKGSGPVHTLSPFRLGSSLYDANNLIGAEGESLLTISGFPQWKKAPGFILAIDSQVNGGFGGVGEDPIPGYTVALTPSNLTANTGSMHVVCRGKIHASTDPKDIHVYYGGDEVSFATGFSDGNDWMWEVDGYFTRAGGSTNFIGSFRAVNCNNGTVDQQHAWALPGVSDTTFSVTQNTTNDNDVEGWLIKVTRENQ